MFLRMILQHPTIFEVITDTNGVSTYTRASSLFSSPYYRWDNSVEPKTEAFPPGFRMIASSNDAGANNGGESGGNMMVECCQTDGPEDEDCEFWPFMTFPQKNCDFLGIAFGKSLSRCCRTSHCRRTCLIMILFCVQPCRLAGMEFLLATTMAQVTAAIWLIRYVRTKTRNEQQLSCPHLSSFPILATKGRRIGCWQVSNRVETSSASPVVCSRQQLPWR